jgi:hypothetical protein
MQTKLLLTSIAALLLATGAAHAQCGFFGSDGGMGRCHGVTPTPPYRAINQSPTTGRTYSTEADYPISKYRVPTQRRSKRK